MFAIGIYIWADDIVIIHSWGLNVFWLAEVAKAEADQKTFWTKP